MFGGLLAPKPGLRKALRLPIRAAAERSNIGSQINHFFEHDTGPCQHPLDRVSGLVDGPRRGVEHKLASLRRLVIIADPGECREAACARLGVMALGVAALADFSGRCDMNLAKR